ncbi:unnamed protein product [Phytomonas sp. EM1]|nr:unnamed protein product [Phytomonas sp. EM1]|eukprot:CCW65213.1 unnamed protein product [Phytomonas sp. isolate EM1]
MTSGLSSRCGAVRDQRNPWRPSRVVGIVYIFQTSCGHYQRRGWIITSGCLRGWHHMRCTRDHCRRPYHGVIHLNTEREAWWCPRGVHRAALQVFCFIGRKKKLNVIIGPLVEKLDLQFRFSFSWGSGHATPSCQSTARTTSCPASTTLLSRAPTSSAFYWTPTLGIGFEPG